ncbi:MAG TPA: Gfo/Idh/MocA family oxidoreductase [Pirellulales bacterium]|nr:Gfo/Idh/MocA family oxidoreductase [Pirellulales bacterium]
MNLTPEQKAVGKENFQSAIGSQYTRRDFLKGGIAAGAVSGAGLGAMYFGYEKSIGDPLRVGVIGTGDEGSVLLGAVTPSFIQVMAIADIRPYNVWRAFHGDHSSDSALKARCGLMTKYGWKSEDEARKNVIVYDKDYHDLLNNKDVEAVIIALPLHLHAKVAIDAMKAGKHVLTEKLMAHDVAQCKEMGRVADQQGKILAVGHQRHYSILYDNAVDMIQRGLIGDLHYIRAQWHRDNLPGHDSWQPPLPNEKMQSEIDKLIKKRDEAKSGADIAALSTKLAQLTAQYEDRIVNAEDYGYETKTLPNGTQRSALEELIRWRIWTRTGGGLMAELGSHQLDAAGIFISALNEDHKKALPLTVAAMGGRQIFPLDRECEDHVYCIYEFPGPGYKEDKNKTIGVTYSSINGNGFGGYGETVLGTSGTLILEREQEVMLFKGSDTKTKVTVAKNKSGGATLDTTESGGGEAASIGKKALESGPPSRGYTEEIEHWAWCIRNPDPANRPRCNPEVALGDAVIALTTNLAIRENRRIDFKPEWFKIDSDETPEGLKPDISRWS